MGAWWMPAAVFAAMYCQDIVATVMVQAEAARRAHLAAACAVLADACGLASLGLIGGSVLYAHDVALSAATLAARLAADYAGTWTGVKAGARLLRGKQ